MSKLSKYWSAIKDYSIRSNSEKYVDGIIKFRNYGYVENSFMQMYSRYSKMNHSELDDYTQLVLFDKVELDIKKERLAIIHKELEFRIAYFMSKSKLLNYRINNVMTETDG